MPDAPHEAAARAVYDATATVYATQIGMAVTPAVEGPIDRALLDAFAELVGPMRGRVADVGCGPGRITALLADRGIDVVGVDISTSMLDIARTAHPGLRFEEGTLTTLPLPDASLVGAVCWYSIIHTPPAQLVEVFDELARVLDDDGWLLVGFQAGDGTPVHRDDAQGSGLPLTGYRHSPDDVARAIVDAGLQMHARTVREPELDHETTPQAFLLAHRRT